MIITLTGENSFGLQRKLQQLSKAFEAEYGDLGLERLDGQEASLEQISEALTSLPFLAAKKMVILRSPSSNKQFSERAEHMLRDVPETTDVIIVEPKLDKRLSYYKYLKAQTDYHDFVELDQASQTTWLIQVVQERGGTISAGDTRYLVERLSADQQLLSNEVEKLLLYDAKITRQTIDVLSEPTPASTIFQLLEVAFAGNAKRTLELYSEQRALKVEPPQIIAMLAWQLHVLALIKTAGERNADDIAKQAKLNPFVVRKSQSIAHKLDLSELNKLVKDLLKIDTAIKSTSIDVDEALQHYLLKMSTETARAL